MIQATFRPLRPETWRGERTLANRRSSKYVFKANWQTTLDDLETELRHLGARHIVIEADFRESDIRLDGWPRSNARIPPDPGIRIAFESRTHGPMVYQCDQYDGWRENVRAISLGLKALRAVDRYGITGSGEQYTGFKAIESKQDGFRTVEDALSWMRVKSGKTGAETIPIKTLARLVARQCHPDHGGSSSEWQRFDEASRLLKKERLL